MSTQQQPPPQAPTFYDVREVAAMFLTSRMTIYRAIRSGELAAVRMRGRWLVPARVIDALVSRAEAAATVSAASRAGSASGSGD
jgi:excisionase family DNA binding protein